MVRTSISFNKVKGSELHCKAKWGRCIVGKSWGGVGEGFGVGLPF